MARMLIAYCTRTHHTEHMAEAIAAGAATVQGATVDVRTVAELSPQDLLGYDAIVLGSPTYYGSMAAPLKKLFDDSVEFHGRLAGKVGGAFASSANVGGGNETTILDILAAMLIHGMVIQGVAQGDHYGPVAINDVDDRATTQCRRHGQAIAALAVRLHG